MRRIGAEPAGLCEVRVTMSSARVLRAEVSPDPGVTTAGARRALVKSAGLGLLLAARPLELLAQCAPPDEDPTIAPRPMGRVLRVSLGDARFSLAATARAARDGDTIEVEPGNYLGDVSAWPQSDLTIRGIGPRPRLIAEGQSAEGKGIMVLKGKRVRIENLEFRGARVRDRNGAGIRLENGPLTVSNCVFADNENGILTGNLTGNEIAIDNSSFEGNGNAEGQAHNLYVGTIARLQVVGCYFARSQVGHLLKSRAMVNTILYNRLTCEDGTSSYELEFPNGGEALVLGNLIQQGAASENMAIVSYGAEGYRWHHNTLSMAFNTLVNERPNGAIFVRVNKGAEQVVLVNNLLVGLGSMSIEAPLNSHGNVEAARREFSDPDRFDYRLRAKSRLVGRAGFRGMGDAVVGPPTREYAHPASSCPLEGTTSLTPLSPGAFQRLAR